ncbi:AAA family ATPase [Pseudomonas monteilii]|uniref:AAA family ATPase n=1 Tax=Pseudomonas monteilii TaxID=76759 RepID=UPI00383AE1D6
MLTSIHADGHTLNLRTTTSENIFDIDSVSLLIGPNGSGKTSFLQTIVQELLPSQILSLTKDWKAVFDFKDQDNTPRPSNWGIIYYNPVPYRPRFRARPNFVDASTKAINNPFHLASHQDTLQGFDLEVRLFAKLRTNITHLCQMIADYYLREKPGAEPKLSVFVNRIQSFYKDIESAKNLGLLDQAKVLNQEIKKLKQEFYSTLKVDILDQAFRRNSKHKVFATFATLNQLITSQKFKEKEAVSFLINHLDLEYNLTHTPTITADRQKKHQTIINNTTLLLDELNIRYLPTIQPHPEKLETELNISKHRALFEEDFSPHAFTIQLPGLSSGQAAICNQLIALYESLHSLSSKENILILIDEGDAFLHLAWQRCYILQLNNFLSRCKSELNIANLQLVIASHSPLLTSDVPSEFICRLESPPISQAQPSFAAPIHTILNRSFDSSTIGEFATRKINATIEKLETQQPLTCIDNYIIASVDDPIISRELKRLQDECGS